MGEALSRGSSSVDRVLMIGPAMVERIEPALIDPPDAANDPTH